MIDEQFDGVTISAQRDGDSASSENDAMIFDTDNTTGGDSDLSFNGVGNAFIISEDNDGSYAEGKAGGGRLTLDFDVPSEVLSINVLDVEETGGTIDLVERAPCRLRVLAVLQIPPDVLARDTVAHRLPIE